MCTFNPIFFQENKKDKLNIGLEIGNIGILNGLELNDNPLHDPTISKYSFIS